MLANYYLDVNQIQYYDASISGVQMLLEGYQYMTSTSLMGSRGMPAIFFRYELSPIKLRYTYFYKKSLVFMTEVFAIIGGMFTVVGILEAMMTSGLSKISKVEKEK